MDPIKRIETANALRQAMGTHRLRQLPAVEQETSSTAPEHIRCTFSPPTSLGMPIAALPSFQLAGIAQQSALAIITSSDTSTSKSKSPAQSPRLVPNPPSSATAVCSDSTGTGLRRRQSSTAGADSASSRPRTPRAGAMPTQPRAQFMSSLFFRRQPQQPEPSVSSPPSTIPRKLFFQHADNDTGDEDSGATKEEVPTLTDDALPSASQADAVNITIASDSTEDIAPRRLQTDSSPGIGIARLGDLSREEDEFDFAILLKPSKREECTGMLALHPHQNERTELQQRDNDNLPANPDINMKRRGSAIDARDTVMQRIVHVGLHVQHLRSLDGKQLLLKIRAPPQVLELGAERLKMRKRRQIDLTWMEFASDLRETFADFDAKTNRVHFLDSEKQRIVHALLTGDARYGLGAGLNDTCPLTSKVVQRMFPLHKQHDLQALREDWVLFWRYHNIDSATAIANHTCSEWSKHFVAKALAQPLDDIAQYFGERVAFYFAWTELYTRWLVVPSVFGIVLFALQVYTRSLDHQLAGAYALLMAIWASAFLVAWRRRATKLAYRWGTLGFEQIETTRSEFRGDPKCSTTNCPRYPTWKRFVKYMATMPSVMVCIVALLVLTYFWFSTRDRLQKKSLVVQAHTKDAARAVIAEITQDGLTLDALEHLVDIGLDGKFWFFFLIMPLLYGMLIPILDIIFTRIARIMTTWENHRTETQFQSHLIVKVFAFRFVHVFASLYYYAFTSSSTRQSLASNGSSPNLLRVAVQLASFMITDQLGRTFMATIVPFIQRRWRARQKKEDANAQFHASAMFHQVPHRRRLQYGNNVDAGYSRRRMGVNRAACSNAIIHAQCVRLEQASDKAWEEAELQSYDPFEDYTEMLIQYGYVTFFSLAFPLAPLLALINNTIKLRTNAFKLCCALQRPIAQKASGIGIWLAVLQLMSVLAIVTNCLHLAFTTTQLERMAPHITSSTKVWVVFAVEHVLLVLKVWMMLVVPAMPTEVRECVQRERENAIRESARAMATKTHVHDENQNQNQNHIHIHTETRAAAPATK